MGESDDWNKEKAESNKKKHGLSFEEAEEVFDDFFFCDIITQCRANAIPEEEIDYSELPPITDFSAFKPGHPDYFEPQSERFTMRMNADLLDYFRSMGRGWQTKVNDFLLNAHACGQI